MHAVVRFACFTTAKELSPLSRYSAIVPLKCLSDEEEDTRIRRAKIN